MRLALDLCAFVTPFVAACFVKVMTSSHANCKSSCYLTVTSASFAAPCVLCLLVLAVQISELMDKYDELWKGFGQMETEVKLTHPDVYKKTEYVVWLSCCLVTLSKLERNFITFSVLAAYVITMLLILAGPYLFLCGAFSAPKKPRVSYGWLP